MSDQEVRMVYIDKMALSMDRDVKRVCEFIETNIPCSKMVGVAAAVNQLAPILWGRYTSEGVFALELNAPPFGDAIECALPQSGATELDLALARAHDGSAVAVDAAVPT